MDRLERHVVLETIVARVAPYIGQTMAAASAQLHCERLGISGESMDAAQLDQLLQRTRNALVIFIGPDKSKQLTAEIRAELTGKGGVS